MSDMVLSFDKLTVEQQAQAGGKGGALARLHQANFPVPDGFVVLPAAFVHDELTPEAWVEVQAHLSQLRGGDEQADTSEGMAFAVRSSAMSEDSAQASFAGEFETVLNVRTNEEIHKAIHQVYGSRQNERVRAYSQAKGMDAEHQIAVVVQQLVRAESSGVLFMANPVTGQRGQAVISAAWGLGEAIVGGVVTPDMIIVDKTTGNVLIRETADKRVMTVQLAGGTEEQPVPDTMQQAPVLSDDEAAQLVRLGVGIEALFGKPMDIEWVMPKGAYAVHAKDQPDRPFAIVQARPITALPEPELPVPTEWKLPEGSYMAVRNNIVELMADPLSPLFGSLGLAAVNASMGRLLADSLGKPELVPDEIIIKVNEYAYYASSWTPGQIGQILLESIGILKRMFSGAVARWVDEGRPRYVTTVERWQASDWRAFPATELLSGVRELAEAAVDAYGALVSGVIPAAWISEGLFTLLYNLLIKRRDDPAAPVYLMGFDSMPIRAEKSLYDLAMWAHSRSGLATYLDEVPAPELAEHLGDDQPPVGVDPDDWHEWQRRFQTHLERYGHSIYNLDFANAVPADDPVPLLETCKWFLSSQATSPHERQHSAAERREAATRTTLERLKGVRQRLFQACIAPAQRYTPMREDGLADVGLSYPLLRQMLRELGCRFVEKGVIAEPDDIFWLNQDEVEQAARGLDRGKSPNCLSEIVAQHRAQWRAAKRATPPRVLPVIRVLGKDLGEIKAARARKDQADSIKGVAASPGRVTAPACVLNAPEDFARMQTGGILVAPLTTPAWTPLFARAAGIVTDVGGPLSHGSIVAREYGIPAVLGTGAATRRILDGEVITVDGSEGKVYLAPRS